MCKQQLKGQKLNSQDLCWEKQRDLGELVNSAVDRATEDAVSVC